MRQFHLYISITVLLISKNAIPQLVINEVSQGAAGAQEYVEFLVIGSGVCNTCIDIRGWIINSNNGWHSGGTITGTGAGDNGCKRFAYQTQWSCLNAGTLILIYNSVDKNTSITAADDPTDSNKDCIYIIPSTNATLFDYNSTNPNDITYTSDYSTVVFTSGAGSWAYLSMSNTDDSFHTVNPSSTTSPYFSVGWGNNTTLQNVYFAGFVTGEVIYMTNTSNNDPFNSANWVDSVVAGNETPGAPNNAANATWISSMKGSCSIPLGAITGALGVSCNGGSDGRDSVIASGGTSPYTYLWNDAATQTTSTATGLTSGIYTVTVTDANTCTATASQVVTQPSVLMPNTSATGVLCNGGATGSATSAPSGGTSPYAYSWNDAATQTTVTATGLTAGTYTVTVTDANSCTTTASQTLTQPAAALSTTTTEVNILCNGNNTGTATAVPAGGTSPYTYSWNDAATQTTSCFRHPHFIKIATR